MAEKYDELYAWTHEVFGKEPFTLSQFRETFQSPDARKVLSDFYQLGLAERLDRGLYRVIPPEDRLRQIVQRTEAKFEAPEGSGLPYAYSEGTAVSIWTDGSYWTGFTKGFRPLHMKVKTEDVADWKGFFRGQGNHAVVPEDRETLYGTVFVLHSEKDFTSVRRSGVHVMPIKETYEFAKENPYAFEPAIPLLAESLKATRHGHATKDVA